MTKIFFLKKLVIFSLPLIIIFIYIEYRLSLLPNIYSIKKENLTKSLSQIRILALGDSHALHGINPDILSIKAFNLALPSQPLYYDYMLTMKYLPLLPKLELIIIPISYITLEYNLVDTPEEWRCYYYLKIFNIPNSKLPIYDLKRYSWLALYSPGRVKTYIAKMFNVNVNLTENISNSGWYMDTANYPKSDSSGKNRVELHHQIMNPQSIKSNIKIIEDMIRFTKQNKIEIILLTLPVYNTYSTNISLDKYKLMQNNIDILMKKYNIKYYNYFFDNRFNADDFIDSDHLNINGANKFSQIINKEILSSNKLKENL